MWKQKKRLYTLILQLCHSRKPSVVNLLLTWFFSHENPNIHLQTSFIGERQLSIQVWGWRLGEPSGRWGLCVVGSVFTACQHSMYRYNWFHWLWSQQQHWLPGSEKCLVAQVRVILLAGSTTSLSWIFMRSLVSLALLHVTLMSGVLWLTLTMLVRWSAACYSTVCIQRSDV